MMTTDSFQQASAVEQGCKYSQFSTCDRMYIRSFLVCCLFPVCPQTDTAQLYNTQSDLCMRTPHLAQGLES